MRVLILSVCSLDEDEVNWVKDFMEIMRSPMASNLYSSGELKCQQLHKASKIDTDNELV